MWLKVKRMEKRQGYKIIVMDENQQSPGRFRDKWQKPPQIEVPEDDLIEAQLRLE